MIYLSLAVAAAAALRGMWSPCGLSMLTSLNPVAERARGNRFWVTGAWYVLGAALGGAALGGACAAGAWAYDALGLPAAACWTLILLAAAACLVSDSGVVHWRLPEHPRQVDERWLGTYRRWIYAGGYGVQIGTGFATYIMTAGVYLTAVLAVLAGSPLLAFVVGLTFGVVRGLAIVVSATARTPARLRSLLARVDRLDAPSLQVVGVVQATVAGVAANSLDAPVWVAGFVAAVLAAVALRTRATACSVPATGTPPVGLTAGGHDHVHEPHLLEHGRR